MISGLSGFYGGIGASLSGICAGRLVQTVSAGNIANVFSEDFQAARVDLISNPGGGVKATISINQEEPVSIPNGDGTYTRMSNVNITDEIMNLKTGGILVQANAAAYMIQSNSIGTIIDMMA